MTATGAPVQPVEAPRPSYRFALRPKWIVWHVIALTVVVSFTNLGLWQLRRLDLKRAENEVIAARSSLPPVPVGEVMAPSMSRDDVAGVKFRRVIVTGEYQVADEVLVRNHTNGGAPGFWVLTPVKLDDGTGTVVNRGWIPLPFGEARDLSAYAAPAGRIRIEGVLYPTQVREGIGIEDPADGKLATLSRVDVPRLAQQVGYPLLPGYVDLVVSEPASPLTYPSPIPPEPLDDGPHLNYAGQWFIFTALTVITYPLLLRRTAQRSERVEP